MRSDVARVRLAALGLSQSALASMIGVELRTLQRWLAGGPTQLVNAEAVARALGLGTAEVFDGVPSGGSSPFEWLRELSALLGTRESPLVRAADVMLEQWKFLDTYVSFAAHPRNGYVHRVPMDAALARGFARFRVRAEGAARLVFGAYVASRLRYDFGEVQVTTERVSLVEYFHTRSMQAPPRSDGSFDVEIWIPFEMKELVVVGDRAFTIRSMPTLGRTIFDFDLPGNASALCFRPAPNQLRQVGLPTHDDRLRGTRSSANG